jgi:hypothetical protein
MSVVMGDYVASFLGASEGCSWDMTAFDVGSAFTHNVKIKSNAIDLHSRPSNQKSSKLTGALEIMSAWNLMFFIAYVCVAFDFGREHMTPLVARDGI